MSRAKKKWLKKFRTNITESYWNLRSDRELLLIYKAKKIAKKTGVPYTVDFSTMKNAAVVVTDSTRLL